MASAIIISVISSVLLLSMPDVAHSAVASALEHAATAVIPSLFCFMVLSRFIYETDSVRILRPLFLPLKKLLKLTDEEASCFVTGNLCGFPTGASIASEIISRENYGAARALTLVAVSNNISMGFTVSFVGAGLYGSELFGWVLYFCQLASSVIICAALRIKTPSAESRPSNPHAARSLSASFIIAVKEGTRSALYLAGFIVTFTVITSYVTYGASLAGIPASVSAVISSLLEVTRGCVAGADIPGAAGFALVSFSCAFSGLCVVFQSASFFSLTGVKVRDYIIIKFIQGVLSAALSLPLYYLLLKSS